MSGTGALRASVVSGCACYRVVRRLGRRADYARSEALQLHVRLRSDQQRHDHPCRIELSRRAAMIREVSPTPL